MFANDPVGILYALSSHLVYWLAQLAASARPPFDTTDEATLAAKAQLYVQALHRLHDVQTSPANATQVRTAATSVNALKTMLSAIFDGPGNGCFHDSTLAAIDQAIEDLNAVT